MSNLEGSAAPRARAVEQTVYRYQVRGSDLCCPGCNQPLDGRHDVLCYEYAKVRQHLRNHITDGHWHDECAYCLRRRREGGNGVG